MQYHQSVVTPEESARKRSLLQSAIGGDPFLYICHPNWNASATGHVFASPPNPLRFAALRSATLAGKLIPGAADGANALEIWFPRQRKN